MRTSFCFPEQSCRRGARFILKVNLAAYGSCALLRARVGLVVVHACACVCVKRRKFSRRRDAHTLPLPRRIYLFIFLAFDDNCTSVLTISESSD